MSDDGDLRGVLVGTVVTAVLLVAGAVGLRTIGGAQPAASATTAPLVVTSGPPPSPSPSPPRDLIAVARELATQDVPAGTHGFARVSSLNLYTPAASGAVVAFHEASSEDSLTMRPFGTCRRNANRTKFTPPKGRDRPKYLVMSSRGRPYPATSAVDIAVPEGTPVLAPVTGIVGDVRRYDLYGRYEDVRVTIIPAYEVSHRVVVIHLAGVSVRRGATVLAGTTPIGVARDLPFRSQINDYVGPGVPHIHIEVKRPT